VIFFAFAIGATLSVTVTVNEDVLEFPLASVALNAFVVVPIGNNDPEFKPAVCVRDEPPIILMLSKYTSR